MWQKDKKTTTQKHKQTERQKGQKGQQHKKINREFDIVSQGSFALLRCFFWPDDDENDDADDNECWP